MIEHTIELYSDGTYSFSKNTKPLLSRKQLEEQNNELNLIVDDYAQIIKELKEENAELEQKKNDLKELLTNAEPIVEQKKLQKIIYGMVLSMIDDKLKENQPTMLSVKIPKDCADKKACLHNHEVNVASMAKYNILNELKKELEDVVNDG